MLIWWPLLDSISPGQHIKFSFGNTTTISWLQSFCAKARCTEMLRGVNTQTETWAPVLHTVMHQWSYYYFEIKDGSVHTSKSPNKSCNLWNWCENLLAAVTSPVSDSVAPSNLIYPDCDWVHLWPGPQHRSWDCRSHIIDNCNSTSHHFTCGSASAFTSRLDSSQLQHDCNKDSKSFGASGGCLSGGKSLRLPCLLICGHSI